MEEQRPIVFTVSDLIRRARPLTAASSLVPSRQISTLERHRNSNNNLRWKASFSTCHISKPQTLKPLNHPTVLAGTLTLPSFAARNSRIACSCFQFSDDSSTICCDVLEFDPRMVGHKIRILAWNFIPFKCGNRGVKDGFLEIIGWEFLHACSESVCFLSDFSSVCFSLGACGNKHNSKASCAIFGVVESISPVFIVPCASGGNGSGNIRGFLVNVLVCQCKSCSSKFLASELKNLIQNNVKDHYFSKNVILYFCGSASSWRPVISRFTSDIVLLTGLKKKLVFIRKGESQLMYVATDEVSLHIAKEWGLSRNANIKGKGKCGSYTGVISGVYMQGMVVELDQDVILLLTDQHLTVPHSVRVGAIVTLKNVHFVDPKFPWGKMLILGACYTTSVCIESFSPFETGCHLKMHSQSLLQKFIDSLSFAARLWVLLVVSCFRKKFAGILSEKEILGSKHTEGLAQKYASLHMPSSAFLRRCGVLVEFCKHDLCSKDREAHYGHLRLVIPIANLISYCETSWKENLEDEKNFSDVVGGINQKKTLSCGGRSYLLSLRRVLRTDEIGVLLLGILKVSLSSGRLQLVDATGVLDITLDLPATWNFDRIFEAKNSILVVESVPPKLMDLDSTVYQPLSCQNIFSNFLPLRRMKTSSYLYHSLTDGGSQSHSLPFDSKENSQELGCGKYHLLMLLHKFPIQQKFQGNLAKMSNMFAQAMVLPWDLLVAEKCEDEAMNIVSSGHWMDSMEKFHRTEKCLSYKRCKIEGSSVEASNSSLNNARNGLSSHFNDSFISYCNSCTENSCGSNHLLELPCLISNRGVNFHWLGMLHCTTEHGKINSSSKLPWRKVLLEFSPDGFCMHEVLKIGYFYLVKHQEEDGLCSIKENYRTSRAKVFISPGNHLWSLAFSSIECLQSSDVFDILPFCNLHTNNNEALPKEYKKCEIPCLTGNTYSDIKVFVPSSGLNLLKNVFIPLDGSPVMPSDFFEGESNINDYSGSMIMAPMQSPGSSFSDYPLPKGNLITLYGLVVAFHEINDGAFPAQPRPVPGEGYLPLFLQGNGSVCIHVLLDNQMVRILCDLSKQNCPVGLGRDVYATFHRILVLSEQKKYMMTPVSFITVNNTNLMNEHLTDEVDCASGTVGLISVASPRNVAAALISDALDLSEPKPMQFRCRVVAVYILVLEKARTAVLQRSACSMPSVGIPFAGFVMDDGSSSCCCWVDSEKAAGLLGLASKKSLLEDSLETFGKLEAGAVQPCSFTVGNLNQILEHCGRIVVKNCGSIFESSCQDLEFTVDSDRLISCPDEDLLRSMITSVTCGTYWTIIGSIMDSQTSSWLEERLTELDVEVPPLLNIWATSVCHTDMLAEARDIIQGLV